MKTVSIVNIKKKFEIIGIPDDYITEFKKILYEKFNRNIDIIVWTYPLLLEINNKRFVFGKDPEVAGNHIHVTINAHLWNSFCETYVDFCKNHNLEYEYYEY